ncbi:AMP-binding protein [Pseudonocardia sp. RS010]|uniref:AMP-binding protein n=1 Tax=Pseudonocardia sp. RS010 TaxID=3385979 RepID=UPI0039A14ADE
MTTVALLLTETSPVVTVNHPDREREAGSIDIPVRGVEVRLVDQAGADVHAGEIGEIAVRGHNVMRGYRNRPQATAEAVPDGWFRTGDLARFDEDGYYFEVDRKKDLIIRGGYNVYKYPRRLWVVDELPKGPTGAVLRREVPVPEEQQS